MPSIGQDLRSFLISQSSIYLVVADRVHQDHVPQIELTPDGYFDPYIWFESLGIGREECTNQPQGQDPDWWEIDLECIAFDVDVAEMLVEHMRNLDGYYGVMGGRIVQAFFVDDQTDDYVPRGVRPDFGATVKALSLEIHRSG